MYACVVRDGSEGRCQNVAVAVAGKSIFCKRHLESRSIELAPEPTSILFRFHGGKALYAALEKTGIPPKPRDQNLLDARNQQEASRIDRDPGRFGGERPATGCAVFGIDGVSDITGIAALADEMHAAGYRRVNDVHWLREARTDGRQAYDAATLVAGFSKSEASVPDEFTPLLEIFSILKEERWGIAKVFANPPKEDGSVLHALELYQRGSGNATHLLHFLEGLWGIEMKERRPVYGDPKPLTQRLGDLMPER